MPTREPGTQPASDIGRKALCTSGERKGQPRLGGCLALGSYGRLVVMLADASGRSSWVPGPLCSAMLVSNHDSCLDTGAPAHPAVILCLVPLHVATTEFPKQILMLFSLPLLSL